MEGKMRQSENYADEFQFSDDLFCKRVWSDYTLILPAVSVGNLGQLAVDILLTNVPGVSKVTSIYDLCVVPVAGQSQFDESICSSLDVFVSEERKVVILQQRSPFVKGRIPTFRKKLTNWISNSDFKSVIMLSSVSAHIRKDKEIGSSPLRFLSTSSQMKRNVEEKCKGEEYTYKKDDETGDYHLPGAGIVKSMFQDCEKQNIPFLSLLIFCHPGNNTKEAIQLVEYLALYFENLKGEGTVLKLPSTWKQPVQRFEAGYIF